jgi:BirA family biotin operon repressor/biotin-[acetyl-CoA-carboxylase] ligase
MNRPDQFKGEKKERAARSGSSFAFPMEEEIYPQIIRLKETPSTNQYIREYIKKEHLPEGSVVVAENQTAGRGQAGNSWEAAPGENLTFSLILYPTCILAKQQFIISQIAALSVKETLERYTGDIAIKWPNDIYWQDKKIGGMLIENSLSGQHIHSSVIGIGLNLNQVVFTSNAPNPVSLRQITGETYDKDAVLDRFLQHFYPYYLLVLQEKEAGIAAAYKSALYRRDGFHPYSDAKGTFEARIQDIEPMGHLLLQLRNGTTRRYAFKEVSYVLES